MVITTNEGHLADRNLTVITKVDCGQCERMKLALDENGFNYDTLEFNQLDKQEKTDLFNIRKELGLKHIMLPIVVSNGQVFLNIQDPSEFMEYRQTVREESE